MPMPPAVVFDLDGTLIDSLPDLLTTLNQLLADHGRRALAAAEVRTMVGEGAAKLVARGFAATGDAPDAATMPDLLADFLGRYETHATEQTRPWPGVVAALERLAGRGHAMAVCTNKPYRPTVAILQALDLTRFFGTVLGGDSRPFKKPDPRHVTATLEAMGGTTTSAVFVGDSPADVAAAKGAGVPVVCVSFGYSRVAAPLLGAHALIDHFDELDDAIARICGERLTGPTGPRI